MKNAKVKRFGYDNLIIIGFIIGFTYMISPVIFVVVKGLMNSVLI